MEKENPFNFNFPIVKNISPKTIGLELPSVQPAAEPPVKERYTDIHGNTVTVYMSGFKSSIGSGKILYGDYGHMMLKGMYIVNENLEYVFRGESPEEYNRILSECNNYHLILKGLQEKFKQPNFLVQPCQGDRLAVNDKIIKALLFYPKMRMIENSIEAEIKMISREIEIDIESGRIVAGKFGIEQ